MTPDRIDPDTKPAGRWRAADVAALAVVSFAGLLVAMNLSLLIPVLPTISTDLHSSGSSVQWLVTVMLLASAVAVPVAGRLGDLYARSG